MALVTLLLTRAQIRDLVVIEDVFASLREGFAARARDPSRAEARRIPLALPAPAPQDAGVMLLAPGAIPGVPAYTVKVHAKFPAADPAIRGVIVLHAIEDGRVLAILESTYATAIRTSVAGAIGADVLARPDARRAAIVGCGAQGRVQLDMLLRVREIEAVRAYDVDEARAARFASEESARHGLPVVVVSSPQAAAEDADVIVTATWARAPFLNARDVAPGAHLTTLGPDQPGKCELAADLIKAARFFADDRDLQVEMGAIGGAGLGGDAIEAEIGEVIAGLAQGRASPDDITVYGSVGLPFQDLAIAWLAYNQALAKGVGLEIDLLD